MEILTVQSSILLYIFTLLLVPHMTMEWTDYRTVNILAYTRKMGNGSIDQTVVVLVNDAIFAYFDKANNTFALRPSASAGFSLLEERESIFCIGEVNKGFYRQAKYLEQLEKDAKYAKQRIELPSVSMYTEFPELQGKSNILYCYATGFYPGDIEINFLNSRKLIMNAETSDLVYSESWTFRVYKYMNITPQTGDEYMCEVKHRSLTHPKTTVWRPQFSSSHPYWVYTLLLGIVIGVMTATLYKKRSNGAPNCYIAERT